MFTLKYLGFEPRLQSRYRDRDLFIAEEKANSERSVHVSLHRSGVLTPKGGTSKGGAVLAGENEQPLNVVHSLEDVVYEYVAIMEL